MTAIEIPTPDPRTLDDASRPFAEAVSGQFAIKRLLGSGGMGMVFLARDKRLDRLVAIKTLPPNLAKDPAVRERFLRETRTAGGLTHPNIVPIHGADEIDGHVFFVMSYVDGDSLAVRTRAAGRLGARAVATYMRDVAAALAHAHSRGIIHRDIKAENILIERATDRALVTDFGIARLAEASPLTATGQVLGTVHYMSPEQVSGDPLDARSDVYSLGVVGFLALTGRFPFDADVASAVLVQHVIRSAPPVSSINRDVPPALASIVDRCLRRDAAHRFASAEELFASLDAILPTVEDRPAVVSDTEAHAVWARAAELQAHTGTQARPALPAKPHTPPARRKDGPRKPGFRVGEVLEAASEAGIDQRYVERALEERGLTGRPAADESSSPAKAVVEKKREHARWPVVRMRMAFYDEVDGELDPRDIERLLNTIRDQVGTIGTTHAGTRELSWSADASLTRWTQLTASVVPKDGRTAVSLERRMPLFPRIAIAAGSIVCGMAGAGIAVAVLAGMLGLNDEEPVAFAALLGGVFTALQSGRILFRSYRDRATRQLGALGNLLVSRVRDSLR